MVVVLAVLAVDLLAVKVPAVEPASGVCYRLEAPAAPASPELVEPRPSTQLFAQVSRPDDIVASSTTYAHARSSSAGAPSRPARAATDAARARYVAASRRRHRRRSAARNVRRGSPRP